MWILGIDTSCDDTGVGLVKDGEVAVNLVASQVALHQAFGGVVPELASREHLKVIRPLAETALAEAGIGPKDLSLVAATRGPGLIGALLVGYTFAKGLAWALRKPFYAIHHLEAHIAAAWPPGLNPPFLALVASGGHTHLFAVEALGRYRLLGATRDDAVGEAFDKVARLLGLGFPGGPEIERLAQEAREKVPFPVPLKDQKGYEFSFSGLKTKAVQLVEAGHPARPWPGGFRRRRWSTWPRWSSGLPRTRATGCFWWREGWPPTGPCRLASRRRGLPCTSPLGAFPRTTGPWWPWPPGAVTKEVFPLVPCPLGPPPTGPSRRPEGFLILEGYNRP